MLLWASVATAATVCVGASPECLSSLQRALDDPDNDTVEIYGTHTGPFHVHHDVTLIGIDDAVLRLTLASVPGPVLGATAALTLRSLTLDANHLAQNLRATGSRVVLEGVTLTAGYAPSGTHGCAAIRSADVTITDAVVSGCWHFGTEAGVWVGADEVAITDTTLRDNDGPALRVVGAKSADLDRLVVRENGVTFRGRVGGVHLIDVAEMSLTRSWFCENVGHRGGGLRVERGCSGDCRVEHAVFQENHARVGGAVVWGGESGIVAHNTFLGNSATTAGRTFAVAAGSVSVETSLVVEAGPEVGPANPGALDPPPTFDTWLDGTLTLTGSAVHVVKPGLRLGEENLDLELPPVFFDGWVAPACGRSVTVDPTVPENLPFVAWPDEATIGALTTDDCGPWCDDTDADGTPAMWDCGPDDPERGIGLEELGDDGIDQDCDGSDVCYQDPDGDGYGSAPVAIPLGEDCPGEVVFGNDCDDADPAVHPGATERPADGIDSDCDTRELCFADADGDGVTGGDPILGDLQCTEEGVGPSDQGDCDDTDPERSGPYCAVRVGGGCSTTSRAAGWLAFVGLALVARRRVKGE